MSQDQKLQTISPRKTKQNFSGLEKKKKVWRTSKKKMQREVMVKNRSWGE